MRITFDPNCPTFAPLPWWKRLLERMTPVIFGRHRVFFTSGDWIICSPENYVRIKEAGAFRLFEERENAIALPYPGVWH